MAVKQLAVFVENAPGRLKAVAQVLADAEVNMRAISLADTSDFGVIRMIVSDNEKALGSPGSSPFHRQTVRCFGRSGRRRARSAAHAAGRI